VEAMIWLGFRGNDERWDEARRAIRSGLVEFAAAVSCV